MAVSLKTDWQNIYTYMFIQEFVCLFWWAVHQDNISQTVLDIHLKK